MPSKAREGRHGYQKQECSYAIRGGAGDGPPPILPPGSEATAIRAMPASILPHVALWLGGWLLLVLPAILSRPLLALVETRYAGVAWEMWSGAEWLVPLMNGEPYSHKPPLLFWLIQSGWRVFGVNDVWPRLLPALFSLAAVVLTWRMGRRLWPEQPLVGPLAGTLLLGSLHWGLFTPALMFDLLLSFWVLLAVSGLLYAAEGRTRLGWPLMAVALGLALLTKGPVALLYVIPFALLAPLWCPRALGLRWYGYLAVSVIGAAAIALAWAVPAALHGGPAYAEAIFWNQSAGRMVESFSHRRPIWWYLPLLPLLLFPWLCWPALWRGLRRLRPRAEPAIGLLLCWLLPALAILCLISGKQAHYLLPLFPAAALLFARALSVSEAVGGARQWPLALILVALGGLILALNYVPERPDWAHLRTPLGPLGGLALMGIASATLLPWRPLAASRRARRLAGLTIAAQAIVAVTVIAPASRYYDPTPAARVIAHLQANGVPVATIGRHQDRFHFAGRLRAPIAELSEQTASEWAALHPDGRIVSYYRGAVPAGPVAPEFTQPFRGRTLVIWPAAAWRHGPPG